MANYTEWSNVGGKGSTVSISGSANPRTGSSTALTVLASGVTKLKATITASQYYGAGNYWLLINDGTGNKTYTYTSTQSVELELDVDKSYRISCGVTGVNDNFIVGSFTLEILSE